MTFQKVPANTLAVLIMFFILYYNIIMNLGAHINKDKTIINTINNFEPRVELINVIVSVDEDSYSVGVSIEFQVINTTRPLTLDLTLERTR